MEIQTLNEYALPLILLGCGGAFLFSAAVVLFFLRYQKRTQAQREQLLQAELQHRQQLIQANICSQEEERVRISRELHDQVGSTLSSLRLLISRMQAGGTDREEQQIMSDQCKQTIDELIHDVRNISHTLTPPALSLWGLTEALQLLCEKINRSTGMPVLCSCDKEDLVQLPFDHALAVYRVIQELLGNTLKHAAATEVHIDISGHLQRITIRYHDNGVGTELRRSDRQGIGLQNIDSRLRMIGADYHTDTAPGQGFSLYLSYPKHTNNQEQEGIQHTTVIKSDKTAAA